MCTICKPKIPVVVSLLFVCLLQDFFFVVSNQLFLMIENEPFPRFYSWSLNDYDVYFGAYLKLTLGYFFLLFLIFLMIFYSVVS